MMPGIRVIRNLLINLTRHFADKSRGLIRGRTGKALLLVYGSDILSKVFFVLVTVMTIRILDKTEYGIYTSMISFSALFASIIGDGLNMSMVRTVAKNCDRRDEETFGLIGTNFAIQIVAAIFLIILLTVASRKLSVFFFGDSLFRKWLIFGLFAGLGSIFIQFSLAIARSFENFKNYAVLNNLRIVIILGCYLLLLAFHKLNLSTITVTWCIVPLIYGAYVLYKEKVLSRFYAQFNAVKCCRYFTEERILITYYLILALFSQLNVLLVGKYKGMAELATFGVAQRYYLFLLLFLSSVSTVLVPKVARMTSDKEQLKRFIRKWLKLSLLIAIPYFLLVIFVSPVVLSFLNNHKYPDANLMFQILAISAWFSLAFSPLTGVLVSLREYKFLAISSFVQQVLTLFLGIWVINSFGVIALIIVFSISNILGHFWAFSRSLFNLRKT